MELFSGPRRGGLAVFAQAGLLFCAASAAFGAAAWPDVESRDVPDAPASSSPRRLVVDTDFLMTGKRLHTSYDFSLNRSNMVRQGSGEVWLSFNEKVPQIRWRGAAHSPRFGDGEITVVVIPQTRQLFTLFKLAQLHEEQCLIYQFPDINTGANADRLQRMRERMAQVERWMEKDENRLGKPGQRLLQIQWTPTLVLEFEINDSGKEITGVRLRRGLSTVKELTFPSQATSEGNFKDEEVFTAPSKNCRQAEHVHDPLAHLEVKAPHEKSSALNDLLLVIQDMEIQPTKDYWSHIFVLLNALTVPGDVAVMIDDPEPPALSKLHAVAFDYTAAVITRGVRHTSGGSIWLDLDARAMRLRGEAKETRVGPLYMDLIAHGGEANGQVFANVNLTVQKEQQCVAYEYPTLDINVLQELRNIADQGLAFYAISALHGEDCGIFVAPLARGRWIHLWVDLESELPHSILRSEIHKSGQVIRSTDIQRFFTADDVGVSTNPDPQWGCAMQDGVGQLAHLGLREVHKRSIELQDTLYALRELDLGFVVLEMFGLTGDVAIMVQEPELPQLWQLPAVSFSYSLHVAQNEKQPNRGSATVTSGTLSADLHTGHVRLTARDAHTTVSVLLEPESLKVTLDLDDRSGNPPECVLLPLRDAVAAPPVFGPGGGGSEGAGVGHLPGELGASRPGASAAGIFDGVEAVGDQECNRFTFLGTGQNAESVEMWYSNEDEAVCRLAMRPPSDNTQAGGFWAMVDIKDWKPVYEGHDESKMDCPRRKDAPHGAWAYFDETEPKEALPSSSVIAKLAQAAGVIGLLPPRAASALTHLVVIHPMNLLHRTTTTTTTAPQVSIFDPMLKAFSFSFTSTSPLQGFGSGPHGGHGHGAHGHGPEGSEMIRHHGNGQVRVDLEKRKLFLKSVAFNVSAGLSEVESQIVFRGDQGRLYTRTKVGGDFEQCWNVNIAHAFPAPSNNGAPANPFMGSKAFGSNFFIPGRDSEPATKHVIYPSQTLRLQIFSSQDLLTMFAMHFDDLKRSVSTGILVSDWTAEPIEDSWFEPADDWTCESIENKLDHLEEHAHFELLRLFFPHGPVPSLQHQHQERQLFEV